MWRVEISWGQNEVRSTTSFAMLHLWIGCKLHIWDLKNSKFQFPICQYWSDKNLLPNLRHSPWLQKSIPTNWWAMSFLLFPSLQLSSYSFILILRVNFSFLTKVQSHAGEGTNGEKAVLDLGSFVVDLTSAVGEDDDARFFFFLFFLSL